MPSVISDPKRGQHMDFLRGIQIRSISIVMSIIPFVDAEAARDRDTRIKRAAFVPLDFENVCWNENMDSILFCEHWSYLVTCYLGVLSRTALGRNLLLKALGLAFISKLALAKFIATLNFYQWLLIFSPVARCLTKVTGHDLPHTLKFVFLEFRLLFMKSQIIKYGIFVTPCWLHIQVKKPMNGHTNHNKRA